MLTPGNVKGNPSDGKKMIPNWNVDLCKRMKNKRSRVNPLDHIKGH